jgi:integrase
MVDLHWLPAQDLAPATLESYAQQHRTHVRPRWGDTPLGEASSLAVVEFEKGLRALGLASSTVVVVMTVVRDLMTDAAAEHLIPRRPRFAPGGGRRAPDDRRPGVAVDLATVRSICDRLGHDESLLVLTAVFTGMRWGEVCGLRRSLLTLAPGAGKKSPASGWYEIDPLVGAVREDVHSRRYFGAPKGGRGRVVDLPLFLVKHLLRRIETRGERDLLFPDTHGQPRRHTLHQRLRGPNRQLR